MLNIKNDQSNKMKAVTIERPINTNVDHGCTEKFPLSKNLYQQYILKTTLLNFSIDIFTILIHFTKPSKAICCKIQNKVC